MEKAYRHFNPQLFPEKFEKDVRWHNQCVDKLNEMLDSLHGLCSRYGIADYTDAIDNLTTEDYRAFKAEYEHIKGGYSSAWEEYKELHEHLSIYRESEGKDEIALFLSKEELEILELDKMGIMYHAELERRASDIIHGLIESYGKMMEQVTVYFEGIKTTFATRADAMNSYMQSVREAGSDSERSAYALVLADLEAGEMEVYYGCEPVKDSEEMER